MTLVHLCQQVNILLSVFPLEARYRALSMAQTSCLAVLRNEPCYLLTRVTTDFDQVAND